LDIGAFLNHANILTGAMDEVFLHQGTALTADQVKGIYARSAKKFAVKNANANVFIPELNVASGVYTPTVASVSNLDTFTAYPCIWSRNGNIVTVSIKVAAKATAQPASYGASVTLPIACAATPTAWGCVNNYQSGVGGAVVYGASATTIIFSGYTTSTSAGYWTGMFQYALN
jgi:hypothetical protein